MEYQYLLRPHHGMCIAFFRGNGYSSEFVLHMSEIIKKLDNAVIRISAQADEICKKCPNNINGMCKTESKVTRYDKKVLEYCGLKDGTIISFNEFRDIVNRCIIDSGNRKEICGDCQWNELCR